MAITDLRSGTNTSRHDVCESCSDDSLIPPGVLLSRSDMESTITDFIPRYSNSNTKAKGAKLIIALAFTIYGMEGGLS